jgi:hypothetical protein
MLCSLVGCLVGAVGAVGCLVGGLVGCLFGGLVGAVGANVAASGIFSFCLVRCRSR